MRILDYYLPSGVQMLQAGWSKLSWLKHVDSRLTFLLFLADKHLGSSLLKPCRPRLKKGIKCYLHHALFCLTRSQFFTHGAQANRKNSSSSKPCSSWQTLHKLSIKNLLKKAGHCTPIRKMLCPFNVASAYGTECSVLEEAAYLKLVVAVFRFTPCRSKLYLIFHKGAYTQTGFTCF